ncbi:hypothetical protein EBME_0622 [bacterium endosymbiont of Mortierella elongata FMR23-6]|nr:hypothetical protein EBME_0622 [bacterium endosymbiont of Mortierella elongata FMR23-6]
MSALRAPLPQTIQKRTEREFKQTTALRDAIPAVTATNSSVKILNIAPDC